MAMLDYLSTPQVDVLAYIRRRQAIPARYHVSIAALKRRQLIADSDSGYDYTLTAAGQALFDERDLRDQTAADFAVGDSVERSGWIPLERGYKHAWLPAEVVKIGDSRVCIRYATDEEMWIEPKYIRKVETAQPTPDDEPGMIALFRKAVETPALAWIMGIDVDKARAALEELDTTSVAEDEADADKPRNLEVDTAALRKALDIAIEHLEIINSGMTGDFTPASVAGDALSKMGRGFAEGGTTPSTLPLIVKQEAR